MTPTTPRGIILDCDPGHDDALAMLLAAGHEAVDLLGVTTVAGNQTLEKTTQNACVVATVAGLLDLPISPGADRPLLRELTVADAIHGASGLDGPAPVPARVQVSGRHAVDFIVETVMSTPKAVTIVATGPLTNVALALAREPRIADAAVEIVIMGGSYTRGNRTPAAEFNIHVDPEAAAIVFGASWRLTMFGLDLTHQAVCTASDQRAIAAIGGPVAQFADDVLTFFRSAYRDVADMPDPPVHDACAVGFVADPTLFELRRATVEIETQGAFTSGMTVVDFRGTGGPGERLVATSLDRAGFWEMMLNAIANIA